MPQSVASWSQSTHSYVTVVDAENILLVDHRNAQLWLPPGGHVEQGEHPRDTVVREIREELGFAPAHEIGVPLMVTCTTTVGLTSGHTDVSLWYVVNAARSQALTYDAAELNGIQWFGFMLKLRANARHTSLSRQGART